MKKIISLYIAVCCILATNAEVKLNFPGEKSASVGIFIKDIINDTVLAENDSERALMPASVMKAITAASTFSTLDKDFRFNTKVYITGDVIDGICDGDILVESCGDPTIDSNLFEDSKEFSQKIVEAIVDLGINQFNGKVIVQETLKDPGCVPQWEIDDVAWSYGAGLFGFNYKDNKCQLYPATKQTSPHQPNLNVILKHDSSVDMLRGIFSDNLYVFGPNLSDKKWVENTTMNSPAEAFAYELTNRLNEKGISVGADKSTANQRNLIYTHVSPSLTEILNQMLIHSHNLYAEGMLRTLAPDASRKAAIKNELSIWNKRGINTGYMRICDGSGLSRADRLRSIFIADVLEWMAKSPYSTSFAALFPSVGVEGTVKNFLKGSPLQGKLVLKTGSMSGVQCYAGYKIDEQGEPTHVVIVLVNGFYCDRATLRSKIELFLIDTLS